MVDAGPSRTSRWIIDARWDGLVCLSTVWVPALLFLLWHGGARLGLPTTEVSLAVFYGALSLPHFLTTFTFTYLDRDQRAHYRSNPVVYFLIPALLIFGGWIYCAAVGPLLLVTLWLLFGEHHVAAQNLGFAALYRQRNREGEIDRKIDHLVWNTSWIATAAYFGTRPVGEPGLHYFLRPAYLLPVQDRNGLVGVLTLFAVAAFVVYLGRQVQRRWRGLPVSWPKLLFMLTTWPSFFVVPFVVQSVEMALILRSGYHAVQYLGLVHLLNERRCAARGSSQVSGLLGRLVAAGPVGYFGLHFAAGFGVWWLTDVFATRPGLGNDLSLHYLFVPGVALAHFFLDGLTWRFSDAHARRTVVPFLAQHAPPAPSRAAAELPPPRLSRPDVVA